MVSEPATASFAPCGALESAYALNERRTGIRDDVPLAVAAEVSSCKQESSATQRRTWPFAVATAASALINPILSRTSHGNIAAVLRPSLFNLLTLAIKNR